jgi:hypothetical protein
MSSFEEQRGLLQRFVGVLRTGALGELDVLLDEDFVDHDRAAGQPSGRVGMKWKLALFRAQHPDARVVLESVEATEDGLVATWSTTATGLGGAVGDATWQFQGRFVVGARIRACALVSRTRVGGEANSTG